MSLKDKRINAGLTQENVAKVIGTSRVTVARWESGIHEPDFETLRKLAKMSPVLFYIKRRSGQLPIARKPKGPDAAMQKGLFFCFLGD